MSENDLMEKIEERIAPFNLLKHAFYQAWSAGELTPIDLREYASEYWHVVSAFPTYLSALHARLPDARLRRAVLSNLAEEEGVDVAKGRPHSDLWMDFAVGMGADRRQVRERELNRETGELIAAFRDMMQREPAAALAALFTYESRVPEISRTKAEGLKAHYSADDATRHYFTVHETADVYHARVWRDALKDEAQSEQAQAAACDAAEDAARALWKALDGVERERQARLSAQ